MAGVGLHTTRPRPCTLPVRILASMSLAEASEARQARLIALRKRKAGESVSQTCVILYTNWVCLQLRSFFLYRGEVEPVVKHRTYDPETKTLKKHAPDDDFDMDTVEKEVDGLAEQIIKEDEERRAQDLVRPNAISSSVV